MTDFMGAAQTAIYDTLNGVISCGVYDDAPYLPEGMPRADFPYCVIGNDTFVPWDNDTFVGANITITLHFWSLYSGMQEVKGLMGEAYDLLNRASFTVAGFMLVDNIHEFSDTITETDGRTRHGVSRYRMTLQKQ